MARQRVKKERLTDSKVDGKNGKSTGLHKKPQVKEKKKKSNLGNIFINIAIVLCIVSSVWFCYAIYMRSWLANRIVTPHPSLRILDNNFTSPALSPEKFWGSYRPQVYFGMKTRSQKSIVTGKEKWTCYNYLRAHCPSLEMMTDIVKNSLNGRFVYNTATSSPRRYYIGVDSYRPPPKQGGDTTQDNFLVHQVTVQVPFEVEVLFESESFTDRSSRLAGEIFTNELERWKQAFDEKFNTIFKLSDKGFSPQQTKFAKAVFSNTIGGMGYFYGQSYVQSIYNEYPLPYLEGPLYTAVPSRSFFPRGFLWDEGFHQLLISKWNPSISREVIGHWLDLMNVEGWIPREQILDNEARSKVPAEFIVQRNENANPPTLFLTIQKLIEDLNGHLTKEDNSYLKRLFPRLKTWYDWYNSTQVGSLPSTYRWRGRDTDTNLFLNPKTLTSGLDDYPRASHPSEDERHVDLRCWMTLASKIMTDIAKIIGEAHQDYQDMYEKLSDNSLLQELHWSEDLKAFSDYGNHTQSIILEREKIYVPPGQPRQHVQPARLIRSVRKQPKLQYVNAFGYVSLFPFLLQILQPDSPKLLHILNDIRDDEKLWTPYGLRSLSKSNPLYLKRNTEYDPPYWRGPIWINMNYLVVRALHFYSTQNGPYQEMAVTLYQELRTNLISNMYKQFVQTGYLWEQYNDSTGKGQGSHPFTGWSSLIVLIMAEQY
ncbi:mannosyl-oligosaccharide glucosidase [Rhincodon typus]|uniref:mannosyl-oligosaccharide glucosidase n=1 Tax=Rhincodon typus TaxID=259920 RepID=UPI00202FDA61|nr:mannosyl-oligosaccharide glucosidase [Rhincodon typus]